MSHEEWDEVCACSVVPGEIGAETRKDRGCINHLAVLTLMGNMGQKSTLNREIMLAKLLGRASGKPWQS